MQSRTDPDEGSAVTSDDSKAWYKKLVEDSSYRRAIDYGVLAVLVLVFIWAVLQRVWRPVVVDEALVVRSASQPRSVEVRPRRERDESARLTSAPMSRDRHAKGGRRIDNDRLTPEDLKASSDTVAPAESPPPSPPTERATQIKINPNTAEWWELDELPGIGEVKARAIVAYREEYRSAALAANPRAEPSPAFQKPEDLAQVKGIGPATVEKMRSMLTFDEPVVPPSSGSGDGGIWRPVRRRSPDG
ncbi:MAG: helix-hairpin-helix domain-containing protein [Phycisphaerales bacterium]|nr:MAG: helix-hairpin-helix domain-containing protein [Phycisphaerales bacterium]